MNKPLSPELFDDTETAYRYMSDEDLKRAHFVFRVVNHPWVSALATGGLKLAMKLRLPVMWIVRRTIFRQFCGGETIEQSETTIDKLGNYQVGTILDYSVEGENSETDFDATCAAVLGTVDEAVKSPHVPFCVFKVTGLGDAGLLARVQAGHDLSANDEAALERIRQRVDKICSRAHEKGIPVLIDAEETWIQNPIDDLALNMMARYNISRALVFTTIQMYRTAGPGLLDRLMAEAESRGFYLGVKLVRGAYMEKERARAVKEGYPDPIQKDKQATDNAYNAGIRKCLAHIARTSLVCGSHNEESTLLLAGLMADAGLDRGDQRIWFSQLLGMSDNISFNLAHAGYNVAKYVPYGPVRSVIPYLIRRAEENTSVAGQSSRELTNIRTERQRRRSASR